MKRLAISILTVIIVASAAIAMSTGEARKTIQDRGVEYTPEAFVKAATQGDAELIELFLAAGMDPDVEAKGTRAIAESSCGEIEIVRMLIMAGAEVNVQKKGGWTPLDEAANARSPEIVRLLLENGADPNLGTPLKVARDRKNKEIEDLLIKAGARE